MSEYAKKIDDLISRFSAAELVPKTIIWSILWHESVMATYGHDLEAAQWAVRPEPGFYGMYLRNRLYSGLAGYKPKGIPTAAGEKLLRSASYGHMQIMGETARVLGFKGQFLTELCQPEENIKWGTKAFASHYRHKNAPKIESQRLEWALQRYNGGGDSGYYLKILKIRRNAPWSELLHSSFVVS